MIKHIVMWKLKDTANGKPKKENALKFKEMLESLPSKIDAIESMEVGIGYIDSNGPVFDMVLTTSHSSREALQEYAIHPEHQKVVEFGKVIVEQRRVVDYEIN